MKFRTELGIEKSLFEINHSNKIMMLGSCFIENIADRLASYKFDVLKNPFGIIYNPFSLAENLNRIINAKKVAKDELVERNGIWHHFDFHGDMSDISVEKSIDKINANLEKANNFVKSCDFLFLTFGTSIVHINNSTGRIVANNHKFPASYFTKSRLAQEQIISRWKSTFEKLYTINPNVKIVLTVSPVRHIKDGIVENQRSKATLLLAVEKLVDAERVFYFPSYELMQDDLRDYRFYAKDLVHPSVEAVDYIWEKFCGTYFSEETMNLNKEINKISKALMHRPLYSQSQEYLDFREKLKEKILMFGKKHPQIDFTEELKRF